MNLLNLPMATKRILTGMQSTGIPHLGNILGAIEPAIALIKEDEKNASYIFVADLHALTSQHHPDKQRKHTHANVATWLSLGYQPSESRHLYRQSQVPQVCELTWYLATHTPFPTLTNAHAYKERAEKPATINAALFTYPILMAADILLYHSTHVPVGKDQKQHLEITRDIAQRFNNTYGTLLTLPEPIIQERIATIPGTDGRKMSKSYGNTIQPLATAEAITQAVMKIKTDSTPLSDPKDPDRCAVFQIYQHVATPEQAMTMRNQYQAGGYGYGEAKKALAHAIVEKYRMPRERFAHYMANPALIEETLTKSEEQVRKVANKNLGAIRRAMGFSTLNTTD